MAYLNCILDFFELITYCIWLMDYFEDGVTNRAFVKQVIESHYTEILDSKCFLEEFVVLSWDIGGILRSR